MAYCSALAVDEGVEGNQLVASQGYVAAEVYSPLTQVARHKGAYVELDVRASRIARQKLAYDVQSYPLSVIDQKHRLFLEAQGRNRRPGEMIDSATYHKSWAKLVIYASVCVASFSVLSLLLASSAYKFALPIGILFVVSLVLTMVRLRVHLSQHQKLTEGPYSFRIQRGAAAI
jgi:hypothetical protein